VVKPLSVVERGELRGSIIASMQGPARRKQNHRKRKGRPTPHCRRVLWEM